MAVNKSGPGGIRTLVQTWDQLRFLHAYFMIGFREQFGHKQPDYSLVSWVFEKSPKLTLPYSSISVLPDRLPPDLAFGKHLARTSKVRLSNLNVVKIKQQERSYFRLLCFENQY